MVFANPNYLYLLLLLIPMIGWYVYKLSKSQASLPGLLVGGVRGAGSGIMDRVLASRAFRVAYGSGSAADRDLGPSAIHE